ncbi:MAG TPA: nicotinate-nucleotide--dimethylbenzimidazole phosphoribosyltransferase [Candidatus Angelobacter sp.]|nr:nicotinate-nucleotide--dimethylbenzimidazole phosphoribosyltransferase [Candidatus Angelobacter sp.]
MERIRQLIKEIESPKHAWRQQAQEHLDRLTKPLGSLGMLEEIAARLASIQETDEPHIDRKAIYVFAADHGITDEGVSAYPREVTQQMVINFLNGGAAINVIARKAAAKVIVVDVGVDAEFPEEPGLVREKVRRGTSNMLNTPAMTEAELEAALQVGLRLAGQAKKQGFDLIGVGEMGIGNTTSASAITAALTGKAPADVTGCGAGLSRPAVRHKIEIVEAVLQKHNLLPPAVPDPLRILRCVGGLEIAAMTGMVLGAAKEHIACVIDGFISTSAAALAFTLQPKVRDYLFAGHQSEEPGHQVLLEKIGLIPLLNLNLRLGEGTGAVLAFHLLETAVKIYNEMATFASAKVSEAAAV